MTFGQTRSRRMRQEERRVRALRNGPESNNDDDASTSEMMTTFEYIEKEKECLRIPPWRNRRKFTAGFGIGKYEFEYVLLL